MADGSNTSESRSFPRLRTACTIRYKRVRASGFLGEGVRSLTVNISGGGVCFETADSMEEGTLLAVELDLPDYDCPVVSLGRVAWCEAKENGKFETGLEFWWVGWGDDSAQKSISDTIKTALED